MESMSFENLISLALSKEKRRETLLFISAIQKIAPDLVALKLCDLLGSLLDNDARAMCLFLLQMMITEHEGCLWNRLSVPTQSNVKSALLSRIKVEESISIINELRSTVLKLAESVNNWPQLLLFLNECVASNSVRLRKSFFLIFAQLAKHVDETLVPCILVSRAVFLTALDDYSHDIKVRTAVLITAIKFIRYLPSLNEKEWFQNVMPDMMRTLVEAFKNGEKVLGHYMLEKLIDLGENEPRFFRTQLVDVLNTMLEIVEDKSLVEEARHFAVRFVLTLVGARKKAPGMMKKVPLFTNTWFAVLLNLLTDIKDEPSWHNAEIIHKDAGQTNDYIVGVLCLRRFSTALGGKTIAPIAIEQLDAYSVAPEWEKRHAALIALASIAGGSSKVMIKYLEQIVDMVLHSFQDPHPRVRWAAINAIRQLSIDFCPYLQKEHHNNVLPALAAAMDDFQSPRVQAIAAEGVEKFCKSEKKTWVPFLDQIVNKLLVLLQNDNQMVQEAALSALGAIADLSMEHFQKYYDLVMPCLRTILVNTYDKSDHMHQSKALECISFVGMAVGREKFGDDLKQVMEVLKSLQESQEKEFTTFAYILKAWSRICWRMGKDFLPSASTVMPLLVEYAQLELDMTVPRHELEDSIHKVKFGGAIICAKGSDLLRAKAMACALLHLFAHSLKEDFYPWISQTASVLVPLMNFYIDSNTRKNASSALPSLLISAKLAVEKGTAQGGGDSYFKQLAADIILAMGDTLYSEPQTKLCSNILSELNKCLEICRPLLNEGQVRSIIDAIKHVITESSGRKRELSEREKSEDFDAEEAELLRDEREQEVEVFLNVGDILITLIKTFKAAFLPFFDELSSYLMPMMGNLKVAAERSKYIYIFDELVEHCGEAALKYYNTYLPFLLTSSNDEDPFVRQNALYGLRLCAEYGGYVFKPFVGEACMRINVVITHLHAREPENEHAYVNAISAFGKICQFHHESIDSAQILPAWLNGLPIRSDMVEARIVHDQLCSMVGRADWELLGPKYEHLPKILSVFAEVLSAGNDLATEETAKHMINLLRNLQKTLPPSTWASAWSLLLPQQEMELESILAPQEDANFSSGLLCCLVNVCEQRWRSL